MTATDAQCRQSSFGVCESFLKNLTIMDATLYSNGTDWYNMVWCNVFDLIIFVNVIKHDFILVRNIPYIPPCYLNLNVSRHSVATDLVNHDVPQKGR